MREHKTMILLGVEDEDELMRWRVFLSDTGVQFAAFAEPDIGNQITAIAVTPSADPRIFKKLRLLS